MSPKNAVRLRDAEDPESDAVSEAATDSVHAYLGSLRRTALLSRQAEVDLAKRMEAGHRIALTTLLDSPAATTELARLGAALVDGSDVRALFGGPARPEEDDAAYAKRVRTLLRRVGRRHDGTNGRGAPPVERRLLDDLIELRPTRALLDGVTAPVRVCLRDIGVAEAEIAACERRAGVPARDLTPLIRRARRSVPGARAVERRLGVRLAELEELAGIVTRARRRIASVERATRGSAAAHRRTLEEIRCGQRIADQARDALVRANLRLVVFVARRHLNRGLPFPDLVQEGNIGLMKGIEKFDHRRGCKLSTYVTWWIRQSISRAISDQSRTLRVPVHVNGNLARMALCARLLVNELGRDPTTDELAERMQMPPDRVLVLQTIVKQPVSLDSPIGTEEDARLLDFVEDHAAIAPDEAAIASGLASETERLLGVLTRREQTILRLRFGIGERAPSTLEDVGQRFGLTRERIRQIEARALDKLRTQGATHPLRLFAETS